MDVDPLVFTQIRQATVSGGATEAKPSRFRNEGQCFYCGEQGHMAKACPKKKYQYSKPCVDGQKTFVNRPKHPDQPQYTRSRYDQPKSDHNRGFHKSNKQGLRFGYYPQGRVASIEEVEEERNENEEYQEEYQESYEPPSLAARTARLSDDQKEEWL